ncbi:hypothetical protein GCM10025862_30170 [Arsenicicoccus piscis]|uniref:M20/M25/M40 family metallo-hydrolase n=1 Tax=Arsenicicoccus piscis TaxID=673954 RepID=A0ABQ6HRB5_9MICO|nr:hypothetical protein GCM10025862_30170 [Arsenicicoccus piscis]
MPRIAEGIAAAHGLEIDVRYVEEYPVTANTPAEADLARRTIETLFAGEPHRHTRWVDPLAGSEDFSFVLREVPCAFVGLGATAPGVDPRTADYNHSPRATFDDGVLADGAAVYAQLAIDKLTELAG